jgi:hypothetical protein
MSMNSDTQIDPQAVINDLLDQIKRLTLDNSMLRAYISAANTPQADASAGALVPEVVED